MFYKKIDFEPSLKSGWKVVVFSSHEPKAQR